MQEHLPHGAVVVTRILLGMVPGTPAVLVTVSSGYWCLCVLAEIRSCNLTASAAPYQPDPAVEHPLRLALVLPQDSDFFFAFSRSLGISLHLGGVPLSRSMA